MVVSEPLTRVVLGPADLAGGLALSDAAGWNQTAEDWALFIERGRVLGCRADSGELVATAATLPYADGQGWISMVLVDPAWRHRGLATELMNECVVSLRSTGITPVLDATPAGAAVYRRIGFVAGFEFERWEAERPVADAGTSAARVAGSDDTVRTAAAADLHLIAALDASGSGVDRRDLLAAFLARGATRAWLTRDAAGFVLARAGRRATQIGPLVAADARDALTLLDAALGRLGGRVFIDVPVRSTLLGERLAQLGFRRQRPFVRMARGAAAALSGSARQFALAGPEFG